ncbi:hypothetical protein [Nocardia sp. NPDC004860]|uniref:hypothetical protein n=1 Tax=Nocardia sp. NPDC004860 TaxID=3154557 RepID=UPI0033A6DCB8
MSADPVETAEQRVADAKRGLDEAKINEIAAQDEFDQALDALAEVVSRAHARMEQLNKELGDA